MPNQNESHLALFSNEKRTTDSHPVMRGIVELSMEDLRWAIEQAKSGVLPVKFRCAVWKKTSKGGKGFLSGVVERDLPQGSQRRNADDLNL
jgi:hypothetical protein